MKGLTMTQPWATLVAISANVIETRDWPTKYRGPIAIHAAKGFPPDARALCRTQPFRAALRPHDPEAGDLEKTRPGLPELVHPSPRGTPSSRSRDEAGAPRWEA